MSTSTRHETVFGVIEDILDALTLKDDEAAQNFRNVLFVSRKITEGDIERAKEEIRNWINLIENQRRLYER